MRLYLNRLIDWLDAAVRRRAERIAFGLLDRFDDGTGLDEAQRAWLLEDVKEDFAAMVDDAEIRGVTERATREMLVIRALIGWLEGGEPPGSDALRLCRHHLPDLLVVDFDLPDGAGPELLPRIREAHWLKTQIDPYLPVLVLRPRGGGSEDRGPDLVADDLLDKPFTYDDLRSRMEAILHRRHGRLDRPVRVQELLVDPGRRKVIVGDREVRLAKKEFTLLRVLASDPTRVFAKEELLRDVWGLRGPAASARTLELVSDGGGEDRWPADERPRRTQHLGAPGPRAQALCRGAWNCRSVAR